jgi:hypothetical protein
MPNHTAQTVADVMVTELSIRGTTTDPLGPGHGVRVQANEGVVYFAAESQNEDDSVPTTT